MRGEGSFGTFQLESSILLSWAASIVRPDPQEPSDVNFGWQTDRASRLDNVYFGSYLLRNRMRTSNLRIGDVTREIPFSEDSERAVVDPRG